MEDVVQRMEDTEVGKKTMQHEGTVYCVLGQETLAPPEHFCALDLADGT